ncbi:MAG: putative ABC transporter permease [Defluviitaleaceae bacterium]|nr:putative ABC transporter permease [Defluviitaleaceae bacterium]
MNNLMSRTVKYTTLWLWGGFVYYCLELLWRGYSHPSMFIAGGICLVLIGGLNNYLPWNLGIVYQALIGAVIITIVEFIFGLIVNVWLGLSVWNYNELPFNLMGQISLPFTLLWIPIAAVAVLLDDYLRWKLYGEQKPQYTLF